MLVILQIQTITMEASKPLKSKEYGKQQLIQTTYIIYTPKIIKFIYNGHEKRLEEHQYIRKQIQSENTKSKYINLMQSHYSVLSKQSFISQRKEKIKLVSNKKPIIYLKGKKKAKKVIAENSAQEQKKEKCKKSAVFSIPQRKIHISQTNFITNFSCQLFSECNEVDADQRNHYRLDDSFKTNKINANSKTQSKRHQYEITDKNEEFSIYGRFSHDFRKRKNIFEQPKLSRTYHFDVSKERSRSRKSIFQQRTKVCDLSFSKDRSVSRRKRIFQGLSQKMSRATVRCHDEQLQQYQIPKAVFEGWQTFSHQTQKQVPSDKEFLPTVEQMRIEQSQVRQVS